MMEEEEESTVKISAFDDSVENHFKAMDTISELCGEDNGNVSLDDTDVQRFSSSITFLREWKGYNYGEKVLRFASGRESHHSDYNYCSISLPQFSSTTVPNVRQEGELGGSTARKCNKDFVMYVGGSVWALDWCPRIHERPDTPVKLEFVAIGAHPPESSYHKIGLPLTGRGVVQIWCIPNFNENKEAAHPPPTKQKKSMPRAQLNKSRNDEEVESNKPKGRPRKNPHTEEVGSKRPRGRPRKNPQTDGTMEKSLTLAKRPIERPRKKQIEESCGGEEILLIEFKRKKERPRKKTMNEPFAGPNCGSEQVQPLAVAYPQGVSELPAVEEASGHLQGSQELPAVEEASGITQEKPKSVRKDSRCNSSSEEIPTCNLSPCTAKQGKSSRTEPSVQANPSLATCFPLTQNEEHDSSNAVAEVHENVGCSVANHCPADVVAGDNSGGSRSIPEDVALPRLFLCLAHDGKVAWDAKWRPLASDFKCQDRMGYLAVVLGNGALVVWNVPLPSTVKCIYSSSPKEGTDPRFIKMDPVFRCSHLSCGGRESLPWTVEWSTLYPHDYLLAGCHDGTVAMWKFSPSGSSGDARPLLCFSADNVPIRAVQWAPVGRDLKKVNVIVTAGHAGLKFWDVRDPFRPLWDLHPAPKFIYGLDWVADPRCLVLCFDDGSLRLLSLPHAAYDAPVNGKPSVGPKQLGMHLLNTSPFAIWNVHISRLTGMVAYCGADGTVFRFQLTTKAVDKATKRYRTPHFKCGSLSGDESAIVVNTQLPVPLIWKKPVNADTPKSMRGLYSIQAKTIKDHKGQVSAILYGDESDNESGLNETPAASRIKRKLTLKSGEQKKDEDVQPLMCREDQDNTLEKGNENGGAVSEVGNFPSKAVAIHKVRWNMNKGSERWLCYGGAAGIVRCQEIVMSDTDRKLAKNR